MTSPGVPPRRSSSYKRPLAGPAYLGGLQAALRAPRPPGASPPAWPRRMGFDQIVHMFSPSPRIGEERNDRYIG